MRNCKRSLALLGSSWSKLSSLSSILSSPDLKGDGWWRSKSSHSSSYPQYNYGLSGKGKSKRFRSNSLPAPEGEVLFGIHPVHLALKAQRRKPFHRLFVHEKFGMSGLSASILDLANEREIPIKAVNKAVLNQMAGNRPHQGVCLDCAPLTCPVWSEEEQVPQPSDYPPIWLYLYNLQDPMNVGAIVRTAFLMRVDRIVMPSSSSCSLSPVMSKASAGSMEVGDLCRLSDTTHPTHLCQWWRHGGGVVVGTAGAPNNLYGQEGSNLTELGNFAVTQPTLLILGNEGSGLSSEVTASCDTLLWIRHGRHLPGVDSLNVSVAAGILLHWMQNGGRKPR